VGAFVTICPQDGAEARQASTWCDELRAEFEAKGHWFANWVDERTPADRAGTENALRERADLVCYFGHGAPDAWLTHDQATVDQANVRAAAGKAVVCIACLTSRELAPEAITAGVTVWLGFTIKVPVIDPHKNVDPIGEAMVAGLKWLASGASVGEAGDVLVGTLGEIADECEDLGGRFHNHPGRWATYYGALALQGHLVVHGDPHHRPLL
jgi:hypothetical protein